MTENNLDDDLTTTRRGFPVFAYNPSAANIKMRSKEKPIRIERGPNVLIIDGDTSEVLGEGTAGFFKREVVDDEQFMKVYVGKLDSMFKLTKTGQHIFTIVWDQVQNNKDCDQVKLIWKMAKLHKKAISERVFQKGVRELLEKEFIYMSDIDGLYFINMGIFFNGNRIIAATEYIKSSSLSSYERRAISNEI